MRKPIKYAVMILLSDGFKHCEYYVSFYDTALYGQQYLEYECGNVSWIEIES